MNHLLKSLFAIFVLILLVAADAESDVKMILKDGHFARLPKNARMIGHEIVRSCQKRFGYLAFKASPEDLAKWIRKSELILTSKEKLFRENILVRPNARPSWYDNSAKMFTAGNIYYARRRADEFTTIVWADVDKRILHVEYEIGQ